MLWDHGRGIYLTFALQIPPSAPVWQTHVKFQICQQMRNLTV